MEVRELKWGDNITKKGKEIGLFEIVSKVEELHIWYYIQNRSIDGVVSECIFYLMIEGNFDDVIIECDSVENCKILAQEHFKDYVIKTFFKN